jgi:SP family general alpha glucoside:H+ symporter-like MFS transporter
VSWPAAHLRRCLSSSVLRAVSEVESDWAWRGPYAAQWVFPIPLLIIAYLGPESPWHYVRKGQFDRVKPILASVARPGHYNDRQLDAYVAYMKHTVTLEKAESANGSWLEMFKGSNLRRTEIVSGPTDPPSNLLIIVRCLVSGVYRIGAEMPCWGLGSYCYKQPACLP